jgi:anhydro-N-acetylmuramic acid kinase
MISYKVIGLMSGTSLDGLDVAACEFYQEGTRWKYKIHAARTFTYSPDWTRKLSQLHLTDALTLAKTDSEYGHLLGTLARTFQHDYGFEAQLIASHGHTIFHQPDSGLTFQIGSGSAIAAETGLPVVCDFRSLDVALGGQGAPLVPLGDRLLFADYDACLNLGGFANISMENGGDRIAFDICPVNIVLNRLASRLGLSYDPDGRTAREGTIDPALLYKLNQLDYFNAPHPKSLGREWVEFHVVPLLSGEEDNVRNLLRTYCEHIALQINHSVENQEPLSILVTGGGARNQFLLERIMVLGNHRWVIPDEILLDFKEAMVFAFLGLLRSLGEPNILRSVTGGRADHCGGASFQPF